MVMVYSLWAEGVLCLTTTETWGTPEKAGQVGLPTVLSRHALFFVSHLLLPSWAPCAKTRQLYVFFSQSVSVSVSFP